MSGFPAKLLAAMAIYLLVGVSPAISALLPFGGDKGSSLRVSNCRDGSRKMTAGKEYGCGCESLDTINNKKTVSSRNLGLRTQTLTPPPAPRRSKPTSMFKPAPPSSVV